MWWVFSYPRSQRKSGEWHVGNVIKMIFEEMDASFCERYRENCGHSFGLLSLFCRVKPEPNWIEQAAFSSLVWSSLPCSNNCFFYFLKSILVSLNSWKVQSHIAQALLVVWKYQSTTVFRKFGCSLLYKTVLFHFTPVDWFSLDTCNEYAFCYWHTKIDLKFLATLPRFFPYAISDHSVRTRS